MKKKFLSLSAIFLGVVSCSLEAQVPPTIDETPDDNSSINE